jgi:hypothetical protein
MNLSEKLFEYLYMPVSRAYTRHILRERPADVLMRFFYGPYFLYVHHYWPHFKKPQSLSEKVWHRMLYNRDPQLTLVSDKLLVREYVSEKVDNKYLIPMLWHGDEPDDIPIDELPQQFVIKANHGCGYNIIVQDKKQLDVPKMKEQLRKWLSVNFCLDTFLGTGWAYRNIKRSIIVESFIGKDGQVPLDYKFFCYAGRAEFVLMTFDRFGSLTEKHFNRKFQPLDLWNGAPQYSGKITRPENYDEMLQLADALAQDFDFIRVDLYSVDNRTYFGELTCYPAGGLARFIPKEYDFIFGEKWHDFKLMTD